MRVLERSRVEVCKICLHTCIPGLQLGIVPLPAQQHAKRASTPRRGNPNLLLHALQATAVCRGSSWVGGKALLLSCV